MKNMCYEMSYQNIVDETVMIKTTTTKTSKKMAPVLLSGVEPVSRTYQYRKVMKPMLERKRRARINRCLDELKELMVTALQSEGENVSKLEKADILELTVRHLHKLRRQQRLSLANPVIDTDRFRAGFTHAANEVSRCLAAIPGVDIQLGTKLMTHLGHSLNTMDKSKPLSIQTQATTLFSTPPISPTSSLSSGYSSNNGVSVIKSTRSVTPVMQANYQMPLTPSSRCSQTPSPRPIDYRSTNDLLKVVNFNQQPINFKLQYVDQKCSSPSLWRPF